MPNALLDNFRAKYPGAYDDLSDSELAQKIVAKWPGAYDEDLADVLGEKPSLLSRMGRKLEEAAHTAGGIVRGPKRIFESHKQPTALGRLSEAGTGLLETVVSPGAIPQAVMGVGLEAPVEAAARALGASEQGARTQGMVTGAGVGLALGGLGMTGKLAPARTGVEKAVRVLAGENLPTEAAPVVPKKAVTTPAEVPLERGPGPELKAAAEAYEPPFTPPKETAADKALGLIEQEKAPGEVLKAEELTPWARRQIVIERNLTDLSDVLENMRGQVGKYRTERGAGGGEDWVGVKSPLPKELQAGKDYDEIQNVISKGLAGKPLTAKQQAYYDRLEHWARKTDGPVTPEDVAELIARRDLPFRSELDAPSAPAPDTDFVIQNGEVVIPNEPADPQLSALADRQLETVAGSREPQAIADALRKEYGITKPVVASVGDVELAQTKSLPDHHEITVPKDSPPSVIHHEMQHIREAEGKGPAVVDQPGQKDVELASYLADTQKAKETAGLPPPPKTPEIAETPFAKPVGEVKGAVDTFTTKMSELTERAKIALAEEPTIERLGTLPRGRRVEYREAGPKPTTFSTEEVKEATAAIVDAARRLKELRRSVRGQIDPIGERSIVLATDAMNRAEAQWTKLRFHYGRGVRAFWTGVKDLGPDAIADLQEAGIHLGRAQAAKIRTPIFNNIANHLNNTLKGFAGKGDFPQWPEWKQFTNDLVDGFRFGLFSVTSAAFDLTGDAAALAMQASGAVGRDVLSFDVRAPAIKGFLRAIRFRPKTTPEVEAGLGTSAMGETIRGFGLKKPGTFLWRKTTGGKIIDNLVGAPLYSKGEVDTFAKRLGASATIWRDAYEAANRRHLKGLERKQFLDDFWQNVPETTAQKAAVAGNKAGFNRPLTEIEERVASNVFTKLVGETFARWPMQFVRAFGEWIGADPAFFRAIQNKTATGKDVAEYLGKTASGITGLYLLDQTFYDRTDFNSMEYVHEDGNRTRLSSLDPVNTGLFLLAVMKGDEAKALKSLRYASVPFARAVIGEGGLVMSLISNLRRAHERGEIDARASEREVLDLLNRAIPGNALLAAVKTVVDPTIREGLGALIPGVSQTLPPVTKATTGEPLQPRQRIPGTEIELPQIRGVPIPGATRLLDPVEKLLFSTGKQVYRGPRQPIAGMPAADIPKAYRREWEVIFGKERNRLLRPLVTKRNLNLEPGSPEYEELRKEIGERDSEAAAYATEIVSRRHGGGARPPRKLTARERAMPGRQ